MILSASCTYVRNLSWPDLLKNIKIIEIDKEQTFSSYKYSYNSYENINLV